MFFNFFIYGAFVRLLLASESPYLCSGLYTAYILLIGLFSGASFLILLGVTAVGLVLSTAFFWLLNEVTHELLWWLLCIVGLLLNPMFIYSIFTLLN